MVLASTKFVLIYTGIFISLPDSRWMIWTSSKESKLLTDRATESPPVSAALSLQTQPPGNHPASTHSDPTAVSVDLQIQCILANSFISPQQ